MRKTIVTTTMALGLLIAGPVSATQASGDCGAPHHDCTSATPPTYDELQAQANAYRDDYVATLKIVVSEHRQIVRLRAKVHHKDAVIARLRHRLASR